MEIRGKGYQHYDNYDAIEVPFTDAIPAGYKGVMGVPISLPDKYCLEQFDLVGMGEDNGMGYSGGVWLGGSKSCLVDGHAKFKRILIRARGYQLAAVPLTSRVGGLTACDIIMMDYEGGAIWLQ